MTIKQYNFVKNTRTIGITLGIVSLILLCFAIFKDKNITATNLITLAAMAVSLTSVIINKPTPPTIP